MPKLITVLIILTIFLSGCSYINKKLNKQDDWVGEEIIEDLIEKNSGISVDLTPDTPEN